MGDMQRIVRAVAHGCTSREWKDLVKITALAIVEGDRKTLERILSNQPGVLQAALAHRVGLLSLAAAKGDRVICQILLDHQADITQKDAAGATPLIHAASQGQTALIQQLINSTAAALLGRQMLLQHATNTGETAVMAAAKNGHLATLKLLVSCGASVLANNCEGCSALHLACKNNQPAVLQHLIDQCHCSCNEPDHLGRTPVMIAARAAAVEVVRLLLQNRQQWGVQLEGSDEAGDSVVVQAVRGDHPEVLEALIATGIKLEASWPEEVGCRCHIAGASSLDPDRQIIPQPTQRGGNLGLEQSPTQQLGAANRALQRLQSSRRQTHELCSSPWELQAPQTVATAAATEEDSSTAGDPHSTAFSKRRLDAQHLQDALMYIAVANGSIAVVAWLLRQGIGLGCVDAEDEHSAVFAAVKHEHIEALLCLVRQTGCSLEPRDHRGRTPLMWAAACGHDSMVFLLVELGADMLAQDLNGHVARQVAQNSGMRATAELLTKMARHRLLT